MTVCYWKEDEDAKNCNNIERTYSMNLIYAPYLTSFLEIKMILMIQTNQQNGMRDLRVTPRAQPVGVHVANNP